MNRVDVVAVNTSFVLRLSKTGRTVGQTRTLDWMDRLMLSDKDDDRQNPKMNCM